MATNIRCQRVRVLWQHDWDKPIGKTLSMYEDDKGLAVEGELLLDIQKHKRRVH